MIIGIDPGKRTGVWVLVDDRKIYGSELPAMAALDEIERATQLIPDNAHIVYAIERYDIGSNTVKLSRQYEAMEVIGAVKYMSHKRGAYGLVVMQSRSDKKRVPDDVLRRLGWWDPKTEGDMHDAQRHALVAAAKYTSWHSLVQRAFGMMV